MTSAAERVDASWSKIDLKVPMLDSMIDFTQEDVLLTPTSTSPSSEGPGEGFVQVLDPNVVEATNESGVSEDNNEMYSSRVSAPTKVYAPTSAYAEHPTIQKLKAEHNCLMITIDKLCSDLGDSIKHFHACNLLQMPNAMEILGTDPFPDSSAHGSPPIYLEELLKINISSFQQPEIEGLANELEKFSESVQNEISTHRKSFELMIRDLIRQIKTLEATDPNHARVMTPWQCGSKTGISSNAHDISKEKEAEADCPTRATPAEPVRLSSQGRKGFLGRNEALELSDPGRPRPLLKNSRLPFYKGSLTKPILNRESLSTVSKPSEKKPQNMRSTKADPAFTVMQPGASRPTLNPVQSPPIAHTVKPREKSIPAASKTRRTDDFVLETLRRLAP